MSKRSLMVSWTAIVVVAVVALVVGAHRTSSRASLSVRAAEVDSVVRCPVCDGLSVEDSSTPIARDLRVQIHDDLAAGESPSEVESSLVARYGESILLEPPRHGVSLVVWILPFVALGGAAGGIAAFGWRRRGRDREDGDLPALSDADRAAVQEELSRWGSGVPAAGNGGN